MGQRGGLLMRKKVLIANIALLLWFALDMTGFSLKEKVLVTQGYQDDGVFFVVFLLSIILFYSYEKLGKYILNIWLFMWFFIQFYFHWVFTIFGPWEGKRNYFSNTIKLIASDEVYIPDLYHIILHILILASLILTSYYIYSVKKPKDAL